MGFSRYKNICIVMKINLLLSSIRVTDNMYHNKVDLILYASLLISYMLKSYMLPYYTCTYPPILSIQTDEMATN